jgi:hypothetical protein
MREPGVGYGAADGVLALTTSGDLPVATLAEVRKFSGSPVPRQQLRRASPGASRRLRRRADWHTRGTRR